MIRDNLQIVIKRHIVFFLQTDIPYLSPTQKRGTLTAIDNISIHEIHSHTKENTQNYNT